MGCIHPRHHRTPESLIKARKLHGPGVHAVLHATTIHEKPDEKSPIVGRLKQWSHVVALGEANGWVQHELGWTYKYFNNDSPCLLTIEDIYVVVALGGVNAYDAPKVGATHITHLDYNEEIPSFGTRGEWVYHPFGWSVMHNADGNPNLKRLVDDAAGLHANEEGQADTYRVIAPPRGLNVRSVPDVTAPVEDTMSVDTVVTKLEVQGDWLRHTKGWSLVWGYEKDRFVLYLEQRGAATPAMKSVQCNCTKCKQPIQANVPVSPDGVVAGTFTEVVIVCPFCDSRFRMKITRLSSEGQKGENPGAMSASEVPGADDNQVEGQANIELHALDGEKSPPQTPRSTNSNDAGAISSMMSEGEGKRSV